MYRVILDTDLAMGVPGSEIDDGFALALAHSESQITLEMITTVNGNADVDSATYLAAELAGQLGIEGVPIFRGASAPLTDPSRRRRASDEVQSAFGHHVPDPGYAAVEMIRLVRENPGEITVVAIGPLTNLAAAISLDPDFASLVKEFVIMGGIFMGQANERGKPGEFNIWMDPEAAQAVLRSGARQRWVGLDVTLRVRLTREHARRLGESGSAFGEFASEYTLGWINGQHERNPGDLLQADSCAMHDPLAVAVLARPDLVTWKDAYVSVVTESEVARGFTVADLLTSADAPPPNCVIATAVDVDEFMSYFLASLSTN